MQSSKKNGTAIEGRGDRRVGLNTSGREECTPAALTFDLAECRPQGQSHSWGETMLQIPIEPGFLLLYNAPHPLLFPPPIVFFTT